MDIAGVNRNFKDYPYPGSNKLATKKHLFSSDAHGAAISKVQAFIGIVLDKGVATEIVVRDDRGGAGVIEVFVTEPKAAR